MKRIGLFGGTFNPIHFGHFLTLQDVKAEFSLDSVFFIPCAIPPHKPLTMIAAAKDRLEMTRLTLAGYSGFEVSEIELARAGPSYTIETVLHFKNTLPKQTKLYLIMGIDAFMEIDSWKAFKNLFRVIPMIVMTRAGQVSESTDLQLRKIENFLKNKVAKGYCFSTSKLHFTHNQMQPVFIAKVKHVNISSTNIRTLIKSHGSVCNFVPAEVESFIKNRGLYL